MASSGKLAATFRPASSATGARQAASLGALEGNGRSASHACARVRALGSKLGNLSAGAARGKGRHGSESRDVSRVGRRSHAGRLSPSLRTASRLLCNRSPVLGGSSMFPYCSH